MVVPPLGNALKVKRDNRGNVIESRRMASTTEDPSDLITTMAYEPHFSRLRHVTGAAPRDRAPDAPQRGGCAARRLHLVCLRRPRVYREPHRQ